MFNALPVICVLVKENNNPAKKQHNMAESCLSFFSTHDASLVRQLRDVRSEQKVLMQC